MLPDREEWRPQGTVLRFDSVSGSLRVLRQSLAAPGTIASLFLRPPWRGSGASLGRSPSDAAASAGDRRPSGNAASLRVCLRDAARPSDRPLRSPGNASRSVTVSAAAATGTDRCACAFGAAASAFLESFALPADSVRTLTRPPGIGGIRLPIIVLADAAVNDSPSVRSIALRTPWGGARRAFRANGLRSLPASPDNPPG